MNLAVIGGSGFIGNAFINRFGVAFENIKVLDSKDAPLDCYKRILDSTVGIDILIHAAFDHSYKSNVVGINNVLKACNANGIKKLIYISSFSVYDPDLTGVVDESSPYSKYNDPYTREKIKVENEINNYKDKRFSVVILQPTIVYGLGGGWTKFAFHAFKSSVLRLPKFGNGICNSVYVDDVASFIYKSCYTDISLDKVIVSGNDNITWKDFYLKHFGILEARGYFTNCNVIDLMDSNDFHRNKLINFVFVLWFRTRIGFIFNGFSGYLKKLRSFAFSSLNTDKKVEDFLISINEIPYLEPIAINRKVHDCSFYVDCGKAKNVFGYKADFSIDLGMENIKEKLKSK